MEQSLTQVDEEDSLGVACLWGAVITHTLFFVYFVLTWKKRKKTTVVDVSVRKSSMEPASVSNDIVHSMQSAPRVISSTELPVADAKSVQRLSIPHNVVDFDVRVVDGSP